MYYKLQPVLHTDYRQINLTETSDEYKTGWKFGLEKEFYKDM